MSLVSSGQISISSSIYAASTQISYETSQSGKSYNYSLARLSRGDYNGTGDYTNGYSGINQNSTSKPDRTSQYSLSEFYSYNHTQNGACSGTSFTDVLSDYCDSRRSYHRIEATGPVSSIVNITVACAAQGGGGEYAIYNIYTEYPFDTYGALTGTPIYSGFNTVSTVTYTHAYTLAGTSQVFHIVCYNNVFNCA
jgi:hypothetical protein